jgi:outer membrane protein assembly factor BamB
MGYLTTPVESNGVVYVLSRSGKLFAIRATDGKAVWVTKVDASASVDNTIYDPLPVSVSNNVVYGGMHNLLFALNVETGKQLWTTRISDEYVFQQTHIVDHSLYVSASHISTHTEDGFSKPSSVFAFDAKGGKKLWQQNFNSWLISSPTVADGAVYVGTFDGNFYALKSGNGSELWRLHLDGRVDLQSAIVSNGVIYVEEDGNATPTNMNSIPSAVIAIDIHGNQLWQVQAESVQTSISMQAVANGVLYISQSPRQIRAYNAKLGSELWHQTYGADYLNKIGAHAGITPRVVVVL